MDAWAALKTRTLCSTAPIRTGGCPSLSAPWPPAYTAVAPLPAESTVDKEDQRCNAIIIRGNIYQTLLLFKWEVCLLTSRRWMENSSTIKHWNECSCERWVLQEMVQGNGNLYRCFLSEVGQRQTSIHLKAPRRKHFAKKTLFSIKVNSHRPWLAGEWICLTLGPALNQENTLFLCVAEVVALKQKGLHLCFSSKCVQWRNKQENSQLPAAHCGNASVQLKWRGAKVGTMHSVHFYPKLELPDIIWSLFQ